MKKKYSIFGLLLIVTLSTIFFIKNFNKQQVNKIDSTQTLDPSVKEKIAPLATNKSMVDLFQKNVLSKNVKQMPIEIDRFQYPDPTNEELAYPEKYDAYQKKKYHARMNALIPTHEVLIKMEERLEQLRTDERVDDDQFLAAEKQLEGFRRLRERYENQPY